ncbi:MAG TPA: VOC family protein [Candidatus Binatia bacterium]|nr:VOC family protein [Candidatus Binatia bacterium]
MRIWYSTVPMARVARSVRPHLTHVALWTSDIGRSVDFYRKYCSLEVVHDRMEPDGGRVVWVGESKNRSRFVIVLIARPVERSSPNSFAHFGFSCASRRDVDERADVARADGVLDLEPRDAGPTVGYFCMLRDPDGNSVEFSFGQALGPNPSRVARRSGTTGRSLTPRGPRAG